MSKENELEDVTASLLFMKRLFAVGMLLGVGFIVTDVLFPATNNGMVQFLNWAIYIGLFGALFGIVVMITSLQRLKQELEKED